MPNTRVSRWLLASALFCAGPLAGQDTLYRAPHVEPAGRQLLAIYIGAIDCQPCVWPPFKSSLRRMWPLLAAQARQAHTGFATFGVAISEDIDSGVAMLQPLSQFDEISIGGGWVNQTAEKYFWADPTGKAAVPQVLIVEREINATETKSQWSVSAHRMVLRVIGADPIRAWVDKGAPLGLARNPD